jgi:hypothetical protein
VFGLDYRFHTNLFQVTVNHIRMESLIGDGGESFGHLDSIFCLVTGDPMDSMANIGRGKL